MILPLPSAFLDAFYLTERNVKRDGSLVRVSYSPQIQRASYLAEALIHESSRALGPESFGQAQQGGRDA